HFEKHISCCENVKLYYDQTNRIEEKLINKIRMKDNMIVNHPDVSRNSVPEQLMLLNKMLLNKKFD
ncbi:hypothetical protein EN860_033130, partial [Mesorhizobium sp. M00.F.Ca.ET.217.01.1.1]